MTLKRIPQAVLVLACVVLAANAAHAQGSIVGTVSDASGALLPGVTVEAASPALIEKVRTAVTDGTGQYQILRLAAGIYTVTFTLPGFSTVRRDGVELQGNFTATINADMRVGGLEETITVTGESPIVDVQSATPQHVADRTVLDTIPAGRTAYDLVILTPGTQRQSGSHDVGGSAILTSPQRTMITHGARGEQLLQRNGIKSSGQSGSENATTQNPNPRAHQEIIFDTAAGAADSNSGGTRINYITRDGGNQFHGEVLYNFANSSFQSDNFTDELRAAGLRNVDSLKLTYDFNPGVGGPLKRDKVWVFLAAWRYRVENYAAGVYYNKNANNPNAWNYDPDLDRPGFKSTLWKDGSARFTVQATPKNKFGFFWHETHMLYYPELVSVTQAPEASRYHPYPIQRAVQVDWTSPISNRLLLEGGWNTFVEANSTTTAADLNPAMISVQEQSTGLVYRAPATTGETRRRGIHMQATASFITGTHAIKTGVTRTHGYNQTFPQSHQPVSYRFNNGVPNRITQYALNVRARSNSNHNFELYVQDRWNYRRLTSTFGLRYDAMSGGWRKMTVGPERLTPDRNFTVEPGTSVNWKDVSPRFGVVYDLFGTGKTALKFSINKYLEGMAAGHDMVARNPVTDLVTQTTRSWNDANRNFVPDCNLLNPLANLECGALADQNFGRSVPGTEVDETLTTGWGKRGWNMLWAAGFQHEVLPSTALEVTWVQRRFGNMRATINRAAPASAFDFFDITAPLSPGLPDGGGYVIKDVYNIKPQFFGQVDDFVTYSSQVESWRGVDINVAMRPRTSGVMLQFGLSFEQSASDLCDMQREYPGAGFGINSTLASGVVLLPLSDCDQRSSWLMQNKMFGSYTVPKVDIQISGTLQNIQGPAYFANYTLTNAVASQALGRPLSGGAANITVPLLSGTPLGLDQLGTGKVYGPRINQLDLRFSKPIRFGPTTVALNLDVYNAFNSSSVLAYNNTFTALRGPTAIMLGRFFKVGTLVSF